jgi:NAD(P)-dependent dehydrogenase (short-subunit alcohol dehydrogenase family)
MHDPRYLYPQPPFTPQPQPFPGNSAAMSPEPDHGEDTYRGSGRLAGRRALITGGDSGIGRAVAIAYAREGADVALSYLPEEQADAEATAEWIRRAGQQVLLLPGDIEPAQQCRDIVAATVDAFGGIDILVNNAAVSEGRTTIAEIDDAFWERTFAVNVHSLFYTTRAAAAVMEPGSVIINTSSEAAKSPMPQYAPYAATKAAVMNMTLSLAQMLISQGIRVNAVLPGSTWTPLIVTAVDAEGQKQEGVAPIGRPAQPAELASSYVMLASDESSYLTGTLLAVSGGKSML